MLPEFVFRDGGRVAPEWDGDKGPEEMHEAGPVLGRPFASPGGIMGVRVIARDRSGKDNSTD